MGSGQNGLWALVARLKGLLGIDRAIGFTLLSRSWSVISLPVTLFCVAHFLSKDEQGYYYTFDSLLGLQVFFDLGIAFVVLQFASHDKAHLEWTAAGCLTGEGHHKARLASLLAKAIKAYNCSAALLFLTVLPVGFYFFWRQQGPAATVEWRLAWVWAALVTAANLRLSPLLAFIEGCGQVAEIARLRLIQQVVGTLLAWTVFALGGRLLAAPALNTGYLLTAGIWLAVTRRHFLRDVLAASDPQVRIRWRTEVWPLQWRITVSYLSGYFIFSLFNPILFAYQGKAVAGRMGMTMKIVDSMRTVCLSWMSTKAAPFGSLVARRQFAELDVVFFRSLRQSGCLLALGCVVFVGVVTGLQWTHHPLADRLLGILPTVLLLGLALANHVIFAEAVYLRAHKQEPFVWLSILGAVTTAATTYYFGRYYGATAVVLACFLSTVFLGVAASTYVFQRKRREWHAPSIPGATDHENHDPSTHREPA